MSEIDLLVREYERFVALPWQSNVAGPERVWFAVYDPPQERRLRLHIPEFEIATTKAGHGWHFVDLTDAFARWMAGHKYREAYFQRPHLMTDAVLAGFKSTVVEQIVAALTGPNVDANAVVAVSGLAALFGFVRASEVMEAVAPSIRGRLLVFFPGSYENKMYRLLDARDGWNYLAIPITAQAQR
ncbi:MAG: DUF1788 domain-containing protein [Caldilineales bacterium]|nr:DUF1788 domain-containing protein [Caldilineales bacterium]